jgi:HEAT repeat protein
LHQVHEARRGGDVEYLLQAAKREPDALARSVAIRALGIKRETRAVPVLRQLLDARDFGVRMVAIRSLGRIGDFDAAGDLLRLATGDDGGSGIRETAISALLELGDRHAVALLGEIVASPTSIGREVKWAIKKLRACRGVEALPALREADRSQLTWVNRLRLKRLRRMLETETAS